MFLQEDKFPDNNIIDIIRDEIISGSKNDICL